MKSKKGMSSSDIAIILNEFSHQLENYSIDNIYELNDILVFRFKGFTPGFPRSLSLVVEPGKRIHLTDYKRTFPPHPTDKILTFRKFLKKGRIVACHQYGSDRIVVFKVHHPETERNFTIFCELFGKGNVVLIEHVTREDGTQFDKVLYALWYRVFRDRRLLPGKEFVSPPTRGKSILEVTEEDLNSLPEEVLGDQIVKVLVRNFGAAGEVVEEVLANAGLPKTQKASEIIPERSTILVEALAMFKKKIEEGPPQILYEEGEEEPFTVLPYPFQSVPAAKRENFESFNIACDQYFSPRELLSTSADEKQQEARLKQLQKQLAKQEEHLVTLREDAEKKKELGNILYSNAHLLEELFNTILSANKKGMPWEEIESRLALGKEKGIPSASIVDQLDYKSKTVHVTLEGHPFELDFTLSTYKIGNAFFKAAKKAERKIIPAEEAIEDTKVKLEETEELREQAMIITKAQVVKKRQKRWYESYHWSRTVNGYLVIAGRSAQENERLVRNRLAADDLFFHADVQGAPYTILKLDDNDLDREGQEPTEQDMEDAARIAGIYSRAWKAGLGSVDVYSVGADQVGFSAPSGEYLPKGGVMVTGRRQYYTVATKLFVGVYFDETYAYLFASGNEDVVKDRVLVHTTFTGPSHGSEKKGELAKKMLKYFEREVSEEDKPKLKTLTLNDLVQKIP